MPGILREQERPWTFGGVRAILSGLAIAYEAYRLSLGGKEAPVIDGMTGGDALRHELRAGAPRQDPATKSRSCISNPTPHSPDMFRVNGPLSNLDAFYETYKVKPGDKMFRPPQERVSIW